MERSLAQRPAGLRRHARLGAAIRAAADRPPLVLGTIVLAAAAVAAVFALKVVDFQPDELGYTRLAREIAHSVVPFTTTNYGSQRLNQLYPLLIAPFWGLFGTITAFRLAHVWNCLLMASTAIPSYLLAREVVRERWAAYLVAALAAAVPWLTMSMSELTEIAAYPTSAWALLAMQRSLAAPSPRRDVIALVAILVATYARLQLILLAPVLVIAMVIHELGYGLTARDPKTPGFRLAAGRLLREHVVLSASGLLGLLVGVPLLLSGVLAGAAGFYGDAVSGFTINGATFDLARSYLAFIALGVGALPAALALGFVFDALAAPLTRRAHAFACLAGVAGVAIIVQVAEISVRFNQSTLQERYAFYIVPLLTVGMCAALLQTRHPGRALVAGSALLAVLVATSNYESARGAFWYAVSPGTTTFYDWVAPAFGAAGGPSAAPDVSALVPAGVAILTAGAALAWLTRRVSGARLLAVIGTAALVFCIVETTHALYNVVHGNASGGGFGAGSLRNANWVDRSVPSGTAVAQLDSNLGGLATAKQIWEQDLFWNQSIDGSYTLDGFGDPYLPTTPLVVDSNSGAITATDRPTPVLHYLVLPTRGFPVVPIGNVIGRSPGGQLELMRLAGPLHAAWSVSGITTDGWLKLTRPMTVHLYALRGAARGCATVRMTFSLSALALSARTLTITGSGGSRTTRLDPGAKLILGLPACARGDSVPELRIASAAPGATADAALTPQLLSVAVVKS